MIRGGCLATSLQENVDLRKFLLFFSMHKSDGVTYSKQENDEQLFEIFFPYFISQYANDKQNYGTW